MTTPVSPEVHCESDLSQDRSIQNEDSLGSNGMEAENIINVTQHPSFKFDYMTWTYSS